MSTKRTLGLLILFVGSAGAVGLVGGACGGDVKAPTNPVADAATHARIDTADAGGLRVKLPEWTYWEPVDVPILANAHAPDLPLTDEQIVRRGGIEAQWSTAPLALHDHVKKQAFGVLSGAGGKMRVGELYVKLRDAQVPFVVTVDALFFLAHLAIDRALADIEKQKLVPAVDVLLARLDMRLLAESKDARADLAPAYNAARGIVAVASSLANPAYAPARDIAEAVLAERGKVLAHAGPSESVVLGVTVDYSQMAPRGMADKDDVHAGYFRAMAWLAQAPLMLAGMGEEGAAGRISVALARTHARAALIMSRLLDSDVDHEAAQAWERIDRLSKFISGPADDLTPRELAKVAQTAGNDLKEPRWIANVKPVDHVRHLATKQHVTRLYDGAGGVGVPAFVPEAQQAPLVRAAPSLRLVGGRVAPDGEVLQGLVFPIVGAAKSPQRMTPATARDGERAIPTGLDIAAWLGSSEARTALHESGDDAYEGYEAALDRLYQRRPAENAVDRHASLYVSALDALATYVAPSRADTGQPGTQTTAWRRRKIEVTLAAWTELRHDAVSFTRLPLPPSNVAPAPRAEAPQAPGFVEPHPEAIAKLVALVRQAMHGLSALGGIDKDSPTRALLEEIDDLLWKSLGIALKEANDEPFSADDAASIAAIPGRIAAIEARLSPTGAAEVALAVDVHTDLGPLRALEEATGPLDEVFMVIPEPRTRQLVLAVGAAIPHYELTQPAAQRLSDSAWRARLEAGPAPARDAFTKGYVVEHGSPYDVRASDRDH